MRHLDVEGEGRVEFDFSKEIDEWKESVGNEELEDLDEVDVPEDILPDGVESTDAFPVKTVPRKDHCRPEIQAAMNSEI